MVLQGVDEKDNTSTSKKQPTCLNNLSFYFTEYCDNTSIHGLKFLGERKRYIIEKIWWAIVILISLSFCIHLILKTYNKWMSAPVIVSFATSETPIWKIPFPAITICPMIKSVKSKFDFADILQWRETNTEYNEQDARKFRYMTLVCPNTLQTFTDENATDTVEDDIINFLIDVSPDFDYTTYLCKWIGNDCTYKVDRYFAPTLTSEGVCYSLNMVGWKELFTSEADLDYYQNFSIKHPPPSQWTLEGGYSIKADFKTFPRRTVLSGPNGGMDLVLYTNGENIDYTCGDSVQGYKVILHHPSQIPRAMQRFFWLPLDQEVTASITPNMISTSEELRSYLPKDRKCYLGDEKVLKFFKLYNQQNCLVECLRNHTYKECGCVAFYMPRDNSTPICGPAMQSCLTEVSIDFLTREAVFQIDLSKKKNSGQPVKKRPTKANCDCLPSCYSLHYDIETSQMNWKWREGGIGSGYDNKTAHMSRLRIFFKDLQFMTSERNELYGQTEFWANCGGLLGLFTGFSFISMIEILYFATLRFICNLKLYGRRYWSGAPELLENN